MIMLEGAKATTETVDALRTGASAMKSIQISLYQDPVCMMIVFLKELWLDVKDSNLFQKQIHFQQLISYSEIKFGLEQSKVFLSISLSLIIWLNSSGEDSLMERMMISSVFHSLVVQHLNCFFELARNQI
ncbi:uncharacterized protein LOC131220860 [Magnolia sinica]|uniref:uncharacterized protein LOC131220860 n=1 Tax=Magnolia sinica TaxID=86752 RepID=UPI00265A29AB|nr:uncharacterized protein LOC131220860 [Magnolia sinica]XP_058071696.1 uncharacterized protein LOC131220860 [Magnolia sinica]XP_058071697.1 uncharacterized protein LOC131220860 [Magnolia sinica]XP_058071698.1 uncharacterized protein LOC131220860 [Magnolia sinica]